MLFGRRGVEELGFGNQAERKVAVDVERWLQFQLLADAVSMKSPSYAGEYEWRAVAFALPKEDGLVPQYRERDGVQTPYVELNFRVESGLCGHRLPLRTIRHGSKVLNGALDETRRMLDQLGYPDCQVG